MTTDRAAIPVGVVMRRPVEGKKTLVVLGAYRGGTSFVAQMLTKLGVDMGKRWDRPIETKADPAGDYPSFEDTETTRAIDAILHGGKVAVPDSEEWAYLRQVIAERDEAHAVWGFKHPSSIFMVDQLLAALRNPHAVVVFRDPIAAWTGDMTRDDNLSWHKCRNHLGCLMDVVEKPRCPTLAVSFERAKENRVAFFSMLAEFVSGQRQVSAYGEKMTCAS